MCKWPCDWTAVFICPKYLPSGGSRIFKMTGKVGSVTPHFGVKDFFCRKLHEKEKKRPGRGSVVLPSPPRRCNSETKRTETQTETTCTAHLSSDASENAQACSSFSYQKLLDNQFHNTWAMLVKMTDSGIRKVTYVCVLVQLAQFDKFY